MIRLPVEGKSFFTLRGRGGGTVMVLESRRLELRYKLAARHEPSRLCLVLTGGGKPAVLRGIHHYPWSRWAEGEHTVRSNQSPGNVYLGESHPRHDVTYTVLARQLCLFGFDPADVRPILAAFKNRRTPDGRKRARGGVLYAGLLKRADGGLELVLPMRRGRRGRGMLLLDGIRRARGPRSHGSTAKTRQSRRLAPWWPGVFRPEPWESTDDHFERIRELISDFGLSPGLVDIVSGQSRAPA